MERFLDSDLSEGETMKRIVKKKKLVRAKRRKAKKVNIPQMLSFMFILFVFSAIAFFVYHNKATAEAFPNHTPRLHHIERATV